MKEEKQHDDEIIQHRPTGPRVTATPPVSLGQLVVRKAHNVGAVAKTALAFVGRHKAAFVTLSVSALLTLCADLLIHSALKLAVATVGLLSFAHNPQQLQYVGPGDLPGITLNSNTYSGFAGLRAFSQAQIPAGSCPGDPKCTKAAKICDIATGAICQDKYIKTDGYIDASGLTGVGQPCAGGSTTASPNCFVFILYDQVGNSAHDLSWAGQFNYTQFPAFVFDGPNGYPSMHTDGSQAAFLQSNPGAWAPDTGIPLINSVLVNGQDPNNVDTRYAFVASGGEHVAFELGDRFEMLWGAGWMHQPGGTRNVWHAVSTLIAGGGQGAPGQGNADAQAPLILTCLFATFATDGSGNITTGTDTVNAPYGCQGTNNYTVDQQVGFGGSGYGIVLPTPVINGKAYCVKTAGNPFTIANCPSASNPTITFSGFPSVQPTVAPALSYFMLDGAMSVNCNPCWSGPVFGYVPKTIFYGDSTWIKGYMMEHLLLSSRDIAMTTTNLQAINNNQCRAYGGLC